MNISKRKKNNLVLKIITSVFALIITLSFVSFTQAADKVPCKSPNNPVGCSDIGGSGGSDVGGSNTGVNIDTGIKNPLGDRYTDIPSFLQAILEFFILIGIPIVTLAIIYCGFLFVTAVGNSEKLKKAKQALIYTLIGAALLLGSLVIAKAIKGTVDEIKAERVIKYI